MAEVQVPNVNESASTNKRNQENLDWAAIMELEEEKEVARAIVGQVEEENRSTNSRKRLPFGSPSNNRKRILDSPSSFRDTSSVSKQQHSRVPFSSQENRSPISSPRYRSPLSKGEDFRSPLSKHSTNSVRLRMTEEKRSPLTKENNNHFRMKCEWDSPRSRQDDIRSPRCSSLSQRVGQYDRSSPRSSHSDRHSQTRQRRGRGSSSSQQNSPSPTPRNISTWEHGVMGTLIADDNLREQARKTILNIEHKRGDSSRPKSPRPTWDSILKEEIEFTTNHGDELKSSRGADNFTSIKDFEEQEDSSSSRCSTPSLIKYDSTESLPYASTASESSGGSKSTTSSDSIFEVDPGTLKRRQKQIDFGKNTICYQNYIQSIPKENRSSDDPVTPNKRFKYSRRSFDAQIRIWRKQLHVWSTDGLSQDQKNEGHVSPTAKIPSSDLGYSSSPILPIEEEICDSKCTDDAEEIPSNSTKFWKTLNLDAMFLDDPEEFPEL